jgi:hypothetical protein
MRLRPAVTVLVPLALIAYGGGGSEDSPVLYKSAGSLQCAASQTTQVRLNAEVAALHAGGVSVVTSGCANDGVGHPAVCSTDNGDLFAISVSPASVAAAQQLGYQSASTLPNAKSIACQ